MINWIDRGFIYSQAILFWMWAMSHSMSQMEIREAIEQVQCSPPPVVWQGEEYEA